jgi:signal transduction histidine kinase
MRERLLVALLALTTLTALLYALPRSYLRVGAVNSQADREVSVSARIGAEVVDARLRAGLPAAGESLVRLNTHDSVVYRTAAGTTLLEGPPPSKDSVEATASVPSGGIIEVYRPRSAVHDAIVRQVRAIVLTGIVALLVAALGAILLSRRLARPFQELAASAGQLGRDGGLEGQLPPYRVKEAEAIAAALRTSSRRLAAAIRQERDFARNVAHQLRSPLTGMRLTVEELGLSPTMTDEERGELDRLLHEIDRLADTVTLLLSFSRQQHLGDTREVELGGALTEAARRWQPLAAEHGRALVAQAPPVLAFVSLPDGVLEQVLDVLVHNAIRHGQGTVRLGVEGQVVTVRDEGTGLVDVPDTDVFRRREGAGGEGEGLGLALCAQLAAVVGGRLELVGREPTTFGFQLPR